MRSARVTVTPPEELVREIDRAERNRSKFVLEAVSRAIDRRRRDDLRRSLREPHREAEEYAALGMDEWQRTLPDEDAASLVDLRAGRAVKWKRGTGWVLSAACP
ncbi:MAG: hypothetical protein HY906_11510 [Deltaproteobacteria bacterium]|nr:hypothetical protein [Deltaproteobacteria bacterium]